MTHAEPSAPISLLEPLTDRELEILRLMAEDLSASEIAERLHLARTTVKWYTQQIYGKLGIEGTGQKRDRAVARARALGLLEAERTPGGRLRYNLPAQTTPLVGRTRELNDVMGLLANPNVRLVTLLGPGGIGKTRLALEVAWRLVEPQAYGLMSSLFPDGVYFVAFQPLDRAENIPSAVAEAVGYPFQSDGRQPLQQLLDFFREKRLLLVLDNFEHLPEGAVPVSEILSAAPGVQALVTSRETISLIAETVYALDGLPFPAETTKDDLPDYDAAQLFLQRAQSVRAGFSLQPDEWQALACICHLVQGMPLAILLAAAWVEVLSLPEIADEIARSFDFLAAEMRDAPRRQWSIRAVFEPTWQQLSAEEQAVLMRMAVFRGGCSRQAAEAVAGARLPILQTFVNKAILSRTPKGRYEMHELLRQYARERLEAAQDDEAARDAHCGYYAEFMQSREEDLKGGDRQLTALDEIDAEFENVRAAWEWAVERHRVGEMARIELSLRRFFVLRGRRMEGYSLFERALVVEDDHPLLGRLMGGLAFFSLGKEAVEWAHKSLAISRNTCDTAGTALVLGRLAVALCFSSFNYEQAHRAADESLALWRELNDTWGISGAFLTKGLVTAVEGDAGRALAFTEEALRLARTIGSRDRMAAALLNMGVSFAELGQPQHALECYEESLLLSRALNATTGVTNAVGNMGWIALTLGNYQLAAQRFQEGAARARECGHVFAVVDNLLGLADALSLSGRPSDAAVHLAHCGWVLQSVEDERPDLWALVMQFRAMAAYRGGEYREALLRAEKGVEYAQPHALRAEESQCQLLLALIENKLGHLDAARQRLHAGLIIVQSKTHYMRAIYAVAALAATCQQIEQATRLAALVEAHHATEYEFKVYARELLLQLKGSLPPGTYAAAVERGAALDPDEVVRAWLEENLG